MQLLQFNVDPVNPNRTQNAVICTRWLTDFFSALVWLCLVGSLINMGCSNTDQEIKELEEYTGPIQQSQNIEMIHSDSARIALRLKAPTQIVYQSLDQEYPDGVDIIIYNRAGDKTTIKANRGYYDKKGNFYRVEGNVRLVNTQQKQKMNTEELIWTPSDKTIHTDRFVTIVTEEEIIKGEGLVAAQDFSSYRILNPIGSFSIEDD